MTRGSDNGGGPPRAPAGVARWLILIGLVALGFGLRLHDLSADPPLGLTWSHAPYTDGARIVESARTKVLWGQWEMDPEDPGFLYYPLTSLLAWAVFKVFGVGLWQANLTGVIPGLVSLILILWLGLRANWWVGAGAVLFAAVGFYFVVYNRLPLGESLMIALMLGVPALLLRGHLRLWQSAAAGLLLAAAAFFVKFHALVLLPVTLVWLVAFREDPGGRGRAGLNQGGAFLGGVLLGAVLWLLVVLLPRPESVAGFLQHNLISHYGGEGEQGVTPGGFLRDRLMAVVGLGTNVRFFGRMPILGLAAVLTTLVFAGDWKGRRGRAHGFESYMGLWLLGGVAALSLLEYRPLRYHVQLIPPVVLLGALGLARLAEGRSPRRQGRPRRRLIWVFLFGVFIAYQAMIEVPVYMSRHHEGSEAFLSALGLDPRAVFSSLARFVSSSGLVLFAAALASGATVGIVLWVWGRQARREPVRISVVPRLALASILVALCLVVDGSLHRSVWAGARHSLRETSVDLARTVGPGAFIVGTTATTLTLENGLRSLPAYGQIAKRGDAEGFRHYPITHFLLRDGALRDFLEANFPETFGRMRFVRRYVIGPAESTLYRVEAWPGAGGSVYEPTECERGMERLAEEDWEGAAEALEAFLKTYPDHAWATLALGLCYEKRGQGETAIDLMRRAAAVAPEDLATLSEVGAGYVRAGRVTEGVGVWRRVVALNPYDARAHGYMRALERSLRDRSARPGSDTDE